MNGSVQAIFRGAGERSWWLWFVRGLVTLCFWEVSLSYVTAAHSGEELTKERLPPTAALAFERAGLSKRPWEESIRRSYFIPHLALGLAMQEVALPRLQAQAWVGYARLSWPLGKVVENEEYLASRERHRIDVERERLADHLMKLYDRLAKANQMDPSEAERSQLEADLDEKEAEAELNSLTGGGKN